MRKNNHNFDSEFLVKAETAKNFLCPADIARYSPKKTLLTCVVEGGAVAPTVEVTVHFQKVEWERIENGIFASNIRVLEIFCSTQSEYFLRRLFRAVLVKFRFAEITDSILRLGKNLTWFHDT